MWYACLDTRASVVAQHLGNKNDNSTSTVLETICDYYIETHDYAIKRKKENIRCYNHTYFQYAIQGRFKFQC